MKLVCRSVLLSLVLLASVTGLAFANARVTSIVPVDGGCIAGPSGNTSQKWDVEPGKTYTVTLTGVTECGNGGTDATINVRVNGVNLGTENQNADLIATLVAPGVYQFDFTIPADASCTLPIFYCTTPNVASSGLLAWRDDGGAWGVHFRASTFGPGCTNPEEIQGPNCNIVPNKASTWGQLKSIYR